MEKLLRPAFVLELYSQHMARIVNPMIVLPDRMYPMDLYNALENANIKTTENFYGWITSKGNYVDSRVAAEIALEANQLDKRIDHLSIQEFSGVWKK